MSGQGLRWVGHECEYPPKKQASGTCWADSASVGKYPPLAPGCNPQHFTRMLEDMKSLQMSQVVAAQQDHGLSV